MKKQSNENGLQIPYEKLSPATLYELIEEYVTRDGTDTGYEKKSLKSDIESVKRQLRQGEAYIVYDQFTQTCNIVHKENIKTPKK